MPRPRRPDPPDGWHHVMSRGVERRPVFFDDHDRILFGRLLGDIHDRHGVEVHAYCLMGNHFHLLVHCPDAGLSDAMHHLLSVFARRVNERVGRWGHLFGGRFVSRLLTEHDYIANVVRYIHRNPLDIAGVTDVATYRWSSHRHYLRLRPRPDWLFTEPVIRWFDGTKAFHAFVSDGHDSPPQRLQMFSPAVNGPDLIDAVDLVASERADASPRHVPALRRAVAIDLLAALDNDARHDVLDELDLAEGTGAWYSAVHRARRLASSDATVGDISGRVGVLLGLRHPTTAA